MMNNKTQLKPFFDDIKHKFSSITKSFSWFTLTFTSGLLLSLVILLIHLFVPFEEDIYKKLVIEEIGRAHV